jgi:hypothetical protein
MVDDPGGEVRLAMGVGVVAQQFISNLPGAVHGQGRCSGIQVMSASLATVGKQVASVEAKKQKGKTVHKVFSPFGKKGED